MMQEPSPPADPAPPGGRFVELGDARVFLEESGDGPTLLCLHGLGGGTHFFGALGAALGARWHVASFDLPGSGASPPAGRFTFEGAADRVVSLAAREGWTRVCLLGHSMGTIVALEVVRRAPELAAGFVFAGGLPEPFDGPRARIAARAEAVRRSGLAGLGPQVVAANFSRRTCQERPEVTALYAKLFELQSPEAYAEAAEALVAWHAPALPRMNDIPCLTITGDEDLYAPPDRVRAFAETLPHGTRVEVMRDCGHVPFLEQPDVFARLVEPFLSRLRWDSTQAARADRR